MAAKSITKKKNVNYDPETERTVPKLDLYGPSKRKTNRKIKASSAGTSLNRSCDEKSALRESLQKLDEDHRRMQQTLEETVAEAEARLEEMRKLLEKRAELHKVQMDEVTEKNLNLENQVSKYEKHLLSNNVDPVTMEVMEVTSEDKEAVEEKRRFSKKRVKDMKERLKQMNEQTSTFLYDIQNMKQQLQELEDIGSRIQVSTDDIDDYEEEDITYSDTSNMKPNVNQAITFENKRKSSRSSDDVPPLDDPEGVLFLTQNDLDEL